MDELARTASPVSEAAKEVSAVTFGEDAALNGFADSIRILLETMLVLRWVSNQGQHPESELYPTKAGPAMFINVRSSCRQVSKPQGIKAKLLRYANRAVIVAQYVTICLMTLL